MVSLRPLLQRRLLSTTASKNPHNHRNCNNNRIRSQKWAIKQVTKSNFSDSVEELKNHISSSDFVAVSLRKTGSFSAPWHRVSPFDAPETAYFKAKYAAERFQILQFAVCPFSIRADKLIAHPYNFHLFPRDELRTGMPSYSFSCQTSHLMSMAREGLDFNTCIYDGISYLSRAQETAAKVRTGNPQRASHVIESTSTPSVADSVFIERIKSRVKHWKNACKNSGTSVDDVLLISMRKLLLGSENYGSRPSMTIDVCSERQVQLVLEMLQGFFDELVPLIIPAKGGGTQAVRVVLTISKEDKDLLESELRDLEEEQTKKVRGFREVIDLISASQKPVVSHNSLNDFTFIHSKFLAPLPSNMDEFKSSLRSVFGHVLDVNHLMREIGSLGKVSSIPAAISYLRNRFFLPTNVEVPQQVMSTEDKILGTRVVWLCQLFTKLCSILKIDLNAVRFGNDSQLVSYANIFNACFTNSQESTDGDIRVWSNSRKKVSSKDLIFLWGFRNGITAGMLKSMLQGSHEVFSEEFNVRLVDKSSAIVVFWQPGLSETFLDAMKSFELSEPLREMVSEGLRASGYEIYMKACSLHLRETNLADSLEKALVCHDSETAPGIKPSEIQWSEMMIDFDNL
ncbi:poly(A)-specific ribonuclease PARN-like [Tripterygium wilfordii]|uniref:Poly(A)-specific ribonuclease PARN-like n=1 Tax=Tripterygium wilfordii TaxID=458696 RepID=A0A7J7D4X1_TRIWF|nr:poly(A)-specific ribonuclease PARN-like isoform X2 [Tripterygium wilfordii]KAF5741319.1 poly(A)-specific ribonuclease PARN-like [Tripterygium wilfordii]